MRYDRTSLYAPKLKKRKKRVVKKRKIRKPKKIIVKRFKRMKKLNKYPLKLKTRKVVRRSGNKFKKRPQKKPVVDVKNLGALGALGAISKSSPNVQVASVNINKNAGGQQSLKTGKFIGALKAKGGKLSSTGMTTVKNQKLRLSTPRGNY